MSRAVRPTLRVYNRPGPTTSNRSNRMLSQSFQFSNHKKQHIDAHDYTPPTVQSSLFPVRSTSRPRCLNSPHLVLQKLRNAIPGPPNGNTPNWVAPPCPLPALVFVLRHNRWRRPCYFLLRPGLWRRTEGRQVRRERGSRQRHTHHWAGPRRAGSGGGTGAGVEVAAVLRGLCAQPGGPQASREKGTG